MNRKNFGFVKVAAATPSVKVADCEHNTSEMIRLAQEASAKSVSAVVFPETGITAYTCGDLFNQRLLIEGALAGLQRYCLATKELPLISIVGLPLEIAGRLYNVGAVVSQGKVLGITPKTFIPNYSEFYDKRWFSSSRELKEKEIRLLGDTVQIGRAHV